MKRSSIALCILICLAGCKSEPTTSPLGEKSSVQKVEDAGIKPNDLKHADAAGLQLWFAQHADVAQSVASQCKAAMKDDTAWKLSDEGRICLGDKFANYGQNAQ